MLTRQQRRELWAISVTAFGLRACLSFLLHAMRGHDVQGVAGVGVAETCGKTVEDKQRREAAEERSHRLANGWHEAQYAGRCLRCGGFFPVGTTIRRYSGSGWACCE